MIEVDAPILLAVQGRGINKVDPAGKPSTTRFLRVCYDKEENSSIVLCMFR